MIGSEIGRYKIVERLGAGGMGEVWKAEDTTLGRPVALKFLAAHLLNDDEAKQRFLREARAAAAVRHPNICHVYEVGEENGKTFLAMDYLEGESLEERIAKGPLPLKDALDIGRQVAEGLKAAHEKGIVHRDIKPANIMVDAEGRATILDFGLARLTEASKLTRADQTVGTAAYMSPEQIQGAEVDHRTDVWALGCVLYEMVAGLRPFKGQYDQALLYEICNQEPEPLTGVRAGLPMDLEFIVGKCLAKDANDRYQSANEIAVDLRTLAEKLKSGRSAVLRASQMTGAIPAATSAAHTVSPAAVLPPDAVVMPRNRQRLLYALLALATLTLLGLAAVHFTGAQPEQPGRAVTRFSFAPEGLSAANKAAVGQSVSISPDGKHVLYIAQVNGARSLWLRSLSDESTRQLPGTEGVGRYIGFWSPDSVSIVYAVGAPENELRRVSIAGGSPIALCKLPATSFTGGSWSADGERIVFSSGGVSYEVSSRGGEPKLLFAKSGPRANSNNPHFLPTGDGPQALVYGAGRNASDQWLAVLNLETGERRELGPGSDPVYSKDGFLIYGPANRVTDRGLWALPFSLDTLEPTGDAFPISKAGVAPTVSQGGTLAYLDRSASEATRTLVWRNRAGEILETVGQPQNYMSEPALSPDGQRIAFRSSESGNYDIWVYDLVRSTRTRLTFEDRAEQTPGWSPSGREIVYSLQGSPHRIMRRAADGTGEAVALVEGRLFNPDWSRDDRYLVYEEDSAEGNRGIRYVELGPEGAAGEPVTFQDSPAREHSPKLSPDGRFVAYVSDESGRSEVYVRPFPSGGGKWQVSVNGGQLPRWRSDGGELYYVNDAGMLMAVSVSTESAFTLGRPQPLFVDPGLLSSVAGGGGYDVSADGQRFLTIAPAEQDAEAAPPTIRVVENWYEEFRDRKQD